MKAPLTPEIERWRRESPIKRWLDRDPARSKERRKRLRERLGVKRIMLYYWINGVALPRTDKFHTICTMIGCPPAAYLQWFKEYPQPEAEGCEQGSTASA